MRNIKVKSTKQLAAITSATVERKEDRYPCVGIPLLYSALSNTCVDDLASSLYNASAVDMSMSGLAFDIENPMVVGDKLNVFLEKRGAGIFEALVAEVRWCRENLPGEYRVGVVIDTSVSATEKKFIVSMDECKARSKVPKEVNIVCPACEQAAIFHFVEYQPVLASRGIMPLYNCSICGTTRSLPGILNQKITL